MSLEVKIAKGRKELLQFLSAYFSVYLNGFNCFDLARKSEKVAIVSWKIYCEFTPKLETFFKARKSPKFVAIVQEIAVAHYAIIN